MTSQMATSAPSALDDKKVFYNRFLLIVAGLGGLLYGVDVGIIAGALPYLEATSGFSAQQLSIVVAAVLLGSVISTLFAGLLADWMGRRSLMALSGVMFVISIPMIALSHGYGPLVAGRLLQGISGGLIGVVVPLYLAECLTASNRGKGTGIFQWLLTLGIVAAALVGAYFSYRVDEVAKLGNAPRLLAFKDSAWRGIFWVSLPPGILFVIGSFMVAESPRWLLRRGKREAAQSALLRSRSEEQANLELREMEETRASEHAKSSGNSKVKDSLLRRKYVIPFVLACIILAFNQATGIQAVHIPFKGTPEILSDIMAGRIEMAWVPLVSSVGPIRDGKVIALAVSTPKRSATLPNVPTIAEAGYPGGEFNFWVGMLAPAKTPREIVARINSELNKAMQQPEVQDRLAKLGAEPMPMTPEQFDAFIKEQYEELGKIMRAAGAKPGSTYARTTAWWTCARPST